MLDLTALRKDPAATASAHVRDGTTQSFETDVIQQSLTIPVIVDFWAPWCGPCKQMMPHLEKIVNDASGALKMVKIDIDRNPELVQIFRVQSVPMVYAFYQGQPVDGFMGAKPESELKAFAAKLLKLAGAAAGSEKPDMTAALAAADAFLDSGHTVDAIAAYSNILDADPENMDAMGGIGWALVADRQAEGVADILASLNDTQKNHPRIKGLVFLMDAALAARDLADDGDKKTKDLQSLFDLARKKLGALDIAGAIDTLIDLTRQNREWNDQQARHFLLQIFDALGPKHPETQRGRRQLSALLFS